MANKQHPAPDNHISFRLPQSYLTRLEEQAKIYGLKSRHELAKLLLMQALEETRSHEILTQLTFLRADIADALQDILYEALDINEEGAEALASRLRARGMTPPESIY